MTVLLHSVLTVSCYNQHFLISFLPPCKPQIIMANQHFLISILPSRNSKSPNQHFTPGQKYI